MKRLSIIIPTYNSSKTIERCINSILTQTFTDYEVLIMDGLSKDNTIDIIKKYNSDKIIIASESDKGVYDAMNKGILKSQGEWLYFLGSDDYLYNKNVLEETIGNIKYNEYDIFYGEIESDSLNLESKGAWSLNKLNYNRCHQAIFYKKKIFNKFGLYNLKYKICADHDLNLKWILDSEVKSIYINKIIAHYSNEGLSTKNIDEIFYNDFIKILAQRGENLINLEQMTIYCNWRIEQEKQKSEMQQIKIYNTPTYKIGDFILRPFKIIRKLLSK